MALLSAQGRSQSNPHQHPAKQRSLSLSSTTPSVATLPPILRLTSPAPPPAPAQPQPRPFLCSISLLSQAVAPTEPSLSFRLINLTKPSLPLPPLLLVIAFVIASRFVAACLLWPYQQQQHHHCWTSASSYNCPLPQFAIPELVLPHLDGASARLHPGFLWLGYHLLCALSPAADHRLGINLGLFVLRLKGAEACPFHLQEHQTPPRWSSHAACTSAYRPSFLKCRRSP